MITAAFLEFVRFDFMINRNTWTEIAESTQYSARLSEEPGYGRASLLAGLALLRDQRSPLAPGQQSRRPQRKAAE